MGSRGDTRQAPPEGPVCVGKGSRVQGHKTLQVGQLKAAPEGSLKPKESRRTCCTGGVEAEDVCWPFAGGSEGTWARGAAMGNKETQTSFCIQRRFAFCIQRSCLRGQLSAAPITARGSEGTRALHSRGEGQQSSQRALPGCVRCHRCLATRWESPVLGMKLSLSRRVTQSRLEAALARPAAAPAWPRERLARAASATLQVAHAGLGFPSAEMPKGWDKAAVSHGDHSGDPTAALILPSYSSWH